MNKRFSNRTISMLATLSIGAFATRALAEDTVPVAATPEAAQEGPGAAPGPKKAGPSLSLPPDAPQQGGLVVAPAEILGAEEVKTSEWKFDITGYFRAPMRMSWGPSTLADPGGMNVGTQLRTPPLVPDANYIDWRYTNTLVAPWTELNFHYGNDRAKATVQIASYNITDSGYRRLEANLGINQAYLTLSFPNIINENGRLNLTVGAFTNRYGAAGRYDAGRYETYLFGRTHVAGERLTFEYDVGNWTFAVEQGFGAKLEPIPFVGPSGGNPWEPYGGPAAQESSFVNHVHAGAIWRKTVLVGAHLIDVFANDIERAGSYMGAAYGGRTSDQARPRLTVSGGDVKVLSGPYGDGYLGYSHMDATNIVYLADALEVLHSFGGWQLMDNYFGSSGTGKMDTVLFQYIFSFGQFFHRPKPFWGDGPELVAGVFGMYNRISGPTALAPEKLKAGAELTYLPLSWLGIGGRFDEVQPNLDDNTQSFAVISPRVILRTAFVTHEQVVLQYSRYFYGANAARGQYPYNMQAGAGGLTGADSNAFQIAGIIWF